MAQGPEPKQPKKPKKPTGDFTVVGVGRPTPIQRAVKSMHDAKVFKTHGQHTAQELHRGLFLPGQRERRLEAAKFFDDPAGGALLSGTEHTPRRPKKKGGK